MEESYMKQRVLVIVGPTAVGKTQLSIELAKRFNGEIISGDSMQIYKHLNIGTAKITKEEQENIPHHLLDFLSPEQTYSASMFQEMAQEKITDIINRGKLPIIVGGTGLYIEGLLDGMQFGGKSSHNPVLREQLKQRFEQEGIDVLYQELIEKDKKAAESIHPNNPRRVLRALEVMLHTGELFSNQKNEQDQYDYLLIGLTTDREILYDRINKRIDIMLEQGLLDEAKWLLEQDFPESTQSLKAIGYKELFPYLKGEETLEMCVDYLKQQSRRYAKRQLTWFRNRMNVQWFDVIEKGSNDVIEEVNKWVKRSY